MKKVLLSIFILVAVILAAQQDPGLELRLDSFRVPPVDISGYSYYDYMHGGYHGFPIRIQDDDIYGQGIYMTFMAQYSPSFNRRQNMAFADMNGNVITSQSLTSVDQVEGYGTLVIDQQTGNPFFAWHVNGYGVTLPLVQMVYDVYNYNYAPGAGCSDPFLINNNDRVPNLPPLPFPNPALVEFEFIYPVIYMGASPHACYQRLYVFMANSGFSWQSDSEGYVKSSAQRLAFADVYFGYEDDDHYYEYVFRENEDDLIWTIKTVDYFEKIHYWTGEKVQAFPSYAVSEDGKVAFAGQIRTEAIEFEWEKYDLSVIDAATPPVLMPNYPEEGTWPNLPGEPYDHFVVINDNYGEGDYHVHRINYEKKWDPYHRLDYEHPIGDLVPFNYSGTAPNYVYENYTNFSMRTSLLTNHTLTFDVYGNLHIPTTYRVIFTEPVNGLPPLEDDIEYWDTWRGAEIIYNIVYDYAADNTRLDRVYPFPLYNVGEVSLPLDFNNDGVLDESVTEFDAQNELKRFFIGSLPFYFWVEAYRDMTNQIKMSGPNDGLMVMMWLDSYKSYLYHTSGFPGHGDYAGVSELFIILSENNGYSWSAPLKLSYHNSPLSGQAYIYPADRPIRRSNNSATIYFIYTEDMDNGPFMSGVGNGGAYVKLAAIDVSWGVSNQEPDLPFVKKTSLSQNYPNPFNPSTTIEFFLNHDSNLKIDIYNIKGQKVKTLIDDNIKQGNHQVVWNGTDDVNRPVSSGIYFYKMTTLEYTTTKRMTLMK